MLTNTPATRGFVNNCAMPSCGMKKESKGTQALKNKSQSLQLEGRLETANIFALE